MKVAVLCEFSGTVRDAFIARGHDAISCDLLQTEKPGPHIQGDARDLDWSSFDLVVAHPPCTHLAVSGARWFAEKAREQSLFFAPAQEDALDFVSWVLSIKAPRIAMENPVSIISSKIRKPDQIIQPWQFGHPETKTTCLWLRNLPRLTPTQVVKPEYMTNEAGELRLDKKGHRYSRVHWMSGRQKDRARIRSRTYSGIADAMAAQWGVAA